MLLKKQDDGYARLALTIRGAVQGVGFRPFIYRLATDLALTGWISNSSQGVVLEVEGSPGRLEDFKRRLQQEKPRHSFIQNVEAISLPFAGYPTFTIRPSTSTDAKAAIILPDLATCPDCLREIFDPNDRRYLYPFTNCTNCGPRFTIIEALPYDRPGTTMRKFSMCPACQEEYDHPRDRRFHAQPNACPQCGPHLELWDQAGRVLDTRHAALKLAARALRQGKIIALKGLGGFQLLVDARRDEAVQRLRRRKNREAKPLALMYPHLARVRDHCRVNPREEQWLSSAQAPIVLLKRRDFRMDRQHPIAVGVAPGNPYLGVMLPYTPLHHLLLAELDFPVVATSGNRADEPICTSEPEALECLADIADLFLVHNRPIARHVDDSILRSMGDREVMLRRSRGYAPLPIILPDPGPPLLAVGAHQKNTIALSVGTQVFVSQHIGDLDHLSAYGAFQRVVADLIRIYDTHPTRVARDLHPDYLSSQFADRMEIPLVRVQHHQAHVLAVMAEQHIRGAVLGVAWDGAGYGPDGTIWGGEFFTVKQDSMTRRAHLRPFRLPGGDKAAREPRRSALGLLYEVFTGELFNLQHLAPLTAFGASEQEILRTMLDRGLNSPWTSSAGRLFDAAAALIGLRQQASFEGQAAMELEFALEGVETDIYYNYNISSSQTPYLIDWEPLLRDLLRDLQDGVAVGMMAAKFHNTLAAVIVSVAQLERLDQIVLAGGCFQNKYLTEKTIAGLRQAGFQPYWAHLVPPNDGGIALGQVMAAVMENKDQGSGVGTK